MIYTPLIGAIMGVLDGLIEARYMNQDTQANRPAWSGMTHGILWTIRAAACLLWVLFAAMDDSGVTLETGFYLWLSMFASWAIAHRVSLNYHRWEAFPSVKVYDMSNRGYDAIWMFLARGDEKMAFAAVNSFEGTILILALNQL